MSYNQGYGQNNSQGYGQYNPYGQQNPYDQRNDNQASQGRYNAPQAYAQENPYGQQGGYGQQRPEYQQHSSSRYDEEQAQGGYEMGAVGARTGNDPNRILNQIRAIDAELTETKPLVERLRAVQTRSLQETDPKADNPVIKELDGLSQKIMQVYTALVPRVKAIKQNPESGNPRNAPQVGRLDRSLKAAINEMHELDTAFRQKQRAQFKRQYQIVRPDASDAEIREAESESNSNQIFSEALLSSNRRGEAQAKRENVMDRHKRIQKLQKDMEVLLQLLVDLDTMVQQQEAQVVDIEIKADNTTQDVTQATVELDGAVEKAKAARRKKWICLGIVVLIILIAVAVGVGVHFSMNPTPK